MGMAVATEDLEADSKRLPELLGTPDTMQKCDLSPDNKPKLRPDCMIVKITHGELERALEKRKRSGDANDPSQTSGRPRKIWIIELGQNSEIEHHYKSKSPSWIPNCPDLLQVMVSLAEVDSDAVWLILARLSRSVQPIPPNPASTLFGSWAGVHPVGSSPVAGTTLKTAAVAAALLEKVRKLDPSWEARLEADARQKESL